MGGVGICEVIEGRGCPSDQIFPKKTPPATIKSKNQAGKTTLMQTEMGAKRQFAFVFEKCTNLHHQK